MRASLERCARRGLEAIAVVLVAAGAAAAPPQEARFAAYSIRDGLSQNTVSALVQDHHGFLWIGTWDGLNRFDGYEFRVYRPDPDDEGAISDSLVSALALTPDGNLWIGTRHGGLNHYHRARDRFLVLPTGEGPAALPSKRIEALLVAQDESLWAATDNGVFRILGPPERPTIERVMPGRSMALAQGPDGVVWIGMEDGALYRHEGGEPVPVSLWQDDPPVAIRAILADRADETWIATFSAEVFRVQGDDVVTRFPLGVGDEHEPGRFRSLARDPDGGLWVGGLGAGLVYFDPDSNTRRAFSQQRLDPHGLQHDDVLALLVDRERTLWIGTLSGGLARLVLGGTGLLHYRHQPEQPHSLNHNTVTAFAQLADGTLLVGTDGGSINALDAETGRFTVMRIAADGGEGIARVWALHLDRREGLWAGTWGGGLYHRPAGADEFAAVASVPGKIITSLAGDGESLWVGSADGGLAQLDLAGTLLAHHLLGDAPGVAGSISVTSLLAEPGGDLWVGTWSAGVARLEPDTGRLAWLHDATGSARQPQHRVRALARGRDGVLWVGTAAGLGRIDPERQRIEHLGTRHGLPGGTIYGIVEDGDGRLWLSTNSGLVRFDPANPGTRLFTPEEGVQDYEFNGGAYIALPGGRAAFGGVNGFNIVDPAAVRPASTPAKVVITDFMLFGRSVHPEAEPAESPLPVAASELTALQLAHRYNMLGFRFAAPLALAPRQLRYAYRLDGFDDDWRIAAPEDRLAVYTNLSPGRYQLRVRAVGADDAVSGEERLIELRIHPPWWGSAPAYIAYAAFALLALVGLVQWRTVALRRHATALQAQVRARTRRLAEQNRLIEEQARHLGEALRTKEQLFARVSHEFRTPLALIIGPIESMLIRERRGHDAAWLRVMRRHARRLLALVDQLLGLAQVSEEAAVHRSPQHVSAVVRGTVAAFDSVAVKRGVVLSLGRVEDAWALATPETLERIITNLVSNAVKYTQPGGHVTVSVVAGDPWVQVVVSDDGPGIPEDEHERIFEPFYRVHDHEQGTGLGLALVRECAAALGGSVAVDSAVGHGATFTVRLAASPAGTAPSSDDMQTERMLLGAEALAPSDPGEDQAPAGAAAPGASVADERARVLVLEDNEDLRALLLATLSPHYQCAATGNGTDGIALALEDPPELVVSDVMMPGADGFEVLRTLKQDERSSHVPVILLTALGDRESLLHGLEEYADDYLVKPCDPDELLLRARNLIEARRVAAQQAARLFGAGASRPDPAAPLRASPYGPREAVFLGRLEKIALGRYAEPEFSVAALAAQVAMSERQLQRKVKALLGITPADYLREMRLTKAAELLRAGHSATQVAMDAGFSSASHFGALFKARFGRTPREYAAQGPD